MLRDFSGETHVVKNAPRSSAPATGATVLVLINPGDQTVVSVHQLGSTRQLKQ